MEALMEARTCFDDRVERPARQSISGPERPSATPAGKRGVSLGQMKASQRGKLCADGGSIRRDESRPPGSRLGPEHDPPASHTRKALQSRVPKWPPRGAKPIQAKVRFEAFGDHRKALQAVGLSEQDAHADS
jgi:hypothetical protein